METIKIRGNHYSYRELNPQQPQTILLVHGHPFDHTMWDDQLDALKNYRLVLPDLLGYGKSAYQFDKIFIEQQALDLALLLDQLKIEQVHLVGLSMGGQIIVEFARLFPHRTKSLVICDANPAGENETSYRNRLNLADKIEQTGMKAYTDGDIHKYLHPDTVSNNKKVYQHLYDMMVSTPTAGAVASHRGRAERRDNYSFLSQLNVPVLVVAGDQDFFTPVEEMEKLSQQIKGAQLVVIPGSGHMPNMEQPVLFNQAMQAFYEKIER